MSLTKQQKLFIGCIAVVCVGTGIYFLTRKKDDAEDNGLYYLSPEERRMLEMIGSVSNGSTGSESQNYSTETVIAPTPLSAEAAAAKAASKAEKKAAKLAQ
ncbi:MAG: hypothetical protein LBH25_10205 [Fibromonadaceae bacterium]|jgi:hypothetical protein|nr:hypothetical protein [Fibromonadaceae bacterium]